MYSLENGASWTGELKNAFKTGTTYASIIYNQQEYNESNFLKEAKLKDVRYVPNAGFIGQAVSRMLTIKMVNNEDSNLNFENADVQFKIGTIYNGIRYNINYGNFIVDEAPKNDATNGTVSFAAYDYMIKFNKDYVNRVIYPCTLKNLLLDICSQAGVELGTSNFANENFIVEDNQFEGKQLREVLRHIAKCAFSWARIGQDNRLYLDFSVNNNNVERITIDDYKTDSFKKANEYYGPVNKVTFGDSDIKGQEESVQDNASIDVNGLKEIIINDNYFAYTTEKRHELIQAGTSLFDLRYMPIQSLDLIGLIYLDCNDIIEVEDLEGNVFASRVFSHIINYNGITSDNITTTGESDNEREYVNTNNSMAQNARTEIIVDRAQKKITAVVGEVGEQNEKISQVTQTVSELSSQIKDIADITTSLESNSAKLQFEDVNQSEPIRVVIHPVGVNIAKLHPHTNLKPSINLVIKTRILRFENTTTNETFDYELPDDLLYYDSENYDEFILDYESLSCVINKKCKWNNDGTVGLLPSERTVEYEFPHIELTEGDYTVSLIKYSNGYLFARMMIKNYYTAQFATRVELHSDIKQTVDDINLSVGKKLEGYSTTTEMNSAIDVKANAITQSVSENYATKTALGNTETSLKSEIKSTAEAITTSVSSTYVTNQSLEDNYSTTEQTATMISTTVSQTTKNNLKNVTVEYALGTSTTTAPTSGWSSTAPTWQQGKYMWQRTKTKTADGTENTSNPTCIAGAKGQDGTNGVSISSITEYYAVSSSNTSAPADSAFKTTMQTMTPTNKYLWNYEIMTFSDNSKQSTIKRVIGTYGDKGTDGTNGIGITSVTNKYQVSSSNTTAPTTWKDTPQTMTATNKYLWNYEIITYSNNTTTTSTPAVIGAYGDKGNAGTNGVSVSSITEYYAVSSSNTTAPADSSFKTTMQTMSATNKYLWNYEVITFSNNTTQNTNKRVIGVYGDKGQAGTNGANGIGITSVTNKYQVSNSNSIAPTSWSNTPQTMTATNKYLWNYEIITYSDNTTTTSTPAVIGVYGDKGQTGNTGKGVKGVVAEYYLSSSESTQTGGSWMTTQPTYKENHYYWTRTKITWTDDTVTYTTPILVEEINSLNKSVASLDIKVGEIQSKVDTIEDLTRTVNGTKTVTLTNCVKGSVLELHIYGNNSVFQAMYPNNTLYPQDNLYPKGDSLITVKYANNTTKTYELGVKEVLRVNGDVYDEYILESGQAKVIRRINSNGTVKTEPTTQNLGEFSIALEEGTNTITIKNYSANIYAKYAIKSAYTDVFATQVQMNSSITQTAESINSEVSKKVDENEVISKINQSAEAVGIKANKIELSANDVLNLLSGNTINLSGRSIKISSNNFSVDENGKMTCNNANINGSITSNNANITGGKIKVKGGVSSTDLLRVEDNNEEYLSYIQPGGAGFVCKNDDYYRVDINATTWVSEIDVSGAGIGTQIRNTGIKTPTVTQTSLESEKKNFEKYNNALETLKNIDIYKYNLKSEQDENKKHIGFVIGNNYKYSEEVTSKDNDGVDIYSFVSLCCQAIKEQQEEIEKLRKEINK